MSEPVEVTRTVLENYQRHVFHYRRRAELHRTARPHRALARVVQMDGAADHILYNPASEIELPRLGTRLPKAVLTAAEAEQVIEQTNVHDPLGPAIAPFSKRCTRPECGSSNW